MRHWKLSAGMGLGALCLSLLPGCAGEPAESPETELTWEEFQAMVYQEPDTGLYIVNGDELIETEAELRDFYHRVVAGTIPSDLDMDAAEEAITGNDDDGMYLIVNRVNGKDDRWSDSVAQNLTYCISKSSFGSRYNSVVSAMDKATAAWEGAANVDFVHDSSLDGNCSRNTSSVVFDVRYVCSGRYLARAFFPSDRRSSREVLIDCTSFGNISPWTLEGVLRHELGHTIGFRHEHTRPEAGTCFEDNSWRALTTYDSASVMHYPQCNGSNNGDLVLTTRDRAGAADLYP